MKRGGTKIKRCRKRPALMASWICACLVGAANAQVPGDWNGDGVFNGSDVPALGSCLLGPDVPASTACQPFSLCGNEDVDTDSVISLQSLPDAPIQCTPWSGERGRGYAGASIGDLPGLAFTTGARAYIQRRDPPLCGGPTESQIASSAAWVGIAVQPNDESPLNLWIQMGYARHRNHPLFFDLPNATMRTNIYCEYSAGPNPQDYFFDAFPAPGSNDWFECGLVDSTSGFGTYYLNSELVRAFVRPGWSGLVANNVQFTGETLNMEDRMPGSLVVGCLFSGCEKGAGFPPSYFAAGINEPDTFRTNCAWFDCERLSGTEMVIFDRR